MRMMSRATPNDVPGSVAPGSGADAATATGSADAAHADMTRGQEGLRGGQSAEGQVGYRPTGMVHSRSAAVGTTLNTAIATADANRSAAGGGGIRPGSGGIRADAARRGGSAPCSRIGKRGRGRPTAAATPGPSATSTGALPAVRVVPGLHLADGRPIDDGGLHELPQLLPRISLGLPSQPQGTGTGRCYWVGNGTGTGTRGRMGRWWRHSVEGSVGLALAIGGTTTSSRRGKGIPPGGIPHQMRIAEGRAAEDPPQLGGAVAAAATTPATTAASTCTDNNTTPTPGTDQGRPGPVVRPAPSRGGREVQGCPARQGPAHHPRGTTAAGGIRSQGQAQTALAADARAAQYRRSDRYRHGW